MKQAQAFIATSMMGMFEEAYSNFGDIWSSLGDHSPQRGKQKYHGVKPKNKNPNKRKKKRKGG